MKANLYLRHLKSLYYNGKIEELLMVCCSMFISFNYKDFKHLKKQA